MNPFNRDAFRSVMNFGLTKGGLGDNVARLPALIKLFKKYPQVYPIIYVPDYFLPIAQLACKGYSCKVRAYSEFKPDTPEGKLPAKDTDGGTCTTLHTHLTDHAFRTLLDEDPECPEDRNYPQIDISQIDISSFNLPSKYIVLTVGHTSKTREWLASEVNKVASYAVSQGLTPVFLGSENAAQGNKYDIKSAFDPGISYDLGINLVNKTTLLEATKIMEGAVAVLGVDNGLLHLAACTQVPIIAGYSMVSYTLRVPTRNGVFSDKVYIVEPEANCRYCQNRTNFFLNHDYRTCMTGTLDCVKQMTSEKFTVYLDYLLEKLNSKSSSSDDK